MATEFVSGSASSKGRDHGLAQIVCAANPRIKSANSQRRGRGLVELTPRAPA